MWPTGRLLGRDSSTPSPLLWPVHGRLAREGAVRLCDLVIRRIAGHLASMEHGKVSLVFCLCSDGNYLGVL